MVNRYAGPCGVCGATVPAKGGHLMRHENKAFAVHLACAGGEPEVVEYYSPMTGQRGRRNRMGRCEDAPCCGCCTF